MISLPEKIRKTFDLVVSWAEVHITLKVERDNQIALKKMVEEEAHGSYLVT